MATETQPQNGVDLGVVHSRDEKGGPEQALTLLENAHRVAEDTITTARAEAERVLLAARHDAQQLRKQAREQSEREVAEASRKAETARAQAQEEAGRLVADARGKVAELEQEKVRLATERDFVAESAKQLAERLLESVDAGSSNDRG
jgi:cell division septum initiation protein DivIVA